MLIFFQVSLSVSLPRLYNSTEDAAFSAAITSGPLYNQYLLHLVLTAHIVQIMATAQLPPEGMC